MSVGPVSVTFTPRRFRSGTNTVAGDCASMTTAAMRGQRCAIQSTAHATPYCFVSRNMASSMCALPSSHARHAPMARLVRSGGMSTPIAFQPPGWRSSTIPARHASASIAERNVDSSQMPRHSRRKSSSASSSYRFNMLSSLVCSGYEGLAFIHWLRSSGSVPRSAENSTYRVRFDRLANALARWRANTSPCCVGPGGVPIYQVCGLSARFWVGSTEARAASDRCCASSRMSRPTFLKPRMAPFSRALNAMREPLRK